MNIVKPTLADLAAGFTVALVLLPQSLAYAQLAGMPPHVGLFASALPLIVFACFASSPYLQTGPTAVTALLIFATLQGAGYSTDDPDFVAYGALLALLVGAIRLILAVTKLGKLAYVLCEPVMMGFTTAAAIVILASQLPKVVGLSLAVPDSGAIQEALWALSRPTQWQLGALALAAITLAAMFGGKKVHPLFPGVLVAVIIGITVSETALYTGDIVGQTSSIPEGFPSLQFSFTWNATESLFIGALVIAILGFAEPSTIARTFADEDQQVWNVNRELFASSLANFVSAISGAIPIGGSFSRSSLNRFAGAKTRWSGGVTGLTMLALLPFASALNPLPLAVLGGVVFGAAYRLIRPALLLELWRRSRSQFLLATATFVGTLFWAPNIHWALLAGLALTVFYHFTVGFKMTETTTTDGDIVLRLHGILWFGSHASFLRQVTARATTQSDTTFHLDFAAIPAIDTEVIKKLISHKNIAFRNTPANTTILLERLQQEQDTIEAC